MKFLIKKAILTCLSISIFLVIAGFFLMTKGCDAPILLAEKGATWIYINRPLMLQVHPEGERVSYRKRFLVEHSPSTATLTVRALGIPEVYFDGKRIPTIKSAIKRWKKTQIVDLSGLVSPGTHEVFIRVINENGPAVLLSSCDALNLFSGPSWEASYDDLLWTQAVSADINKDSEVAQQFIRTDKALVSLLPLYVPLFLVVFSITLIAVSPKLRAQGLISRFIPTSSDFRWFLLTFWVILAVNNILKIPFYVGMDIEGHYKYIGYIINEHRIPFAHEGWEMFQSPFYYIISAFLYSPLSHVFDRSTCAMLIRVIPLLCGIMQVELTYRAARSAFPQRQDLQIWGTTIGGLLPMNLYMSQVVGNEPLAGLLSASALVIGLHFLTTENEILSEKYFVLLGTVLGLAILTKVTAILLIPLTVTLMIYALHKRQQSRGYIMTRVVLVGGIIVVIAGWYYTRNWIELGKPFIGNWGFSDWWQDPGFRTGSNFLSFGHSLSAPIYSQVRGFWDALYSTIWTDGGLSGIAFYEWRPPWHYDFMLSGTLLSLVPAAGILAGVLITIIRSFYKPNPVQTFAVCCLGVYIAAVLYFYITVPIYSTAKATFTLGIIPCYAILSVAGLDYIARNNLMRAIVNAFLACWAVAAYCSYFVLK